ANLLSAWSAEPQGAIWQRMASSGSTGVSKSAQRVKKAGSPDKRTAQVNVLYDSHAMLFLSGKSKAVGAANGVSAPAAALTLHPSLPLDNLDVAAVEPATESSSEAAPQIASLP